MITTIFSMEKHTSHEKIVKKTIQRIVSANTILTRSFPGHSCFLGRENKDNDENAEDSRGKSVGSLILLLAGFEGPGPWTLTGEPR